MLGVSHPYPLLDGYYTGDSDPMPCVAPISITVERGDRRFAERVRCGQCRSCRIRRKQAWTGRMMVELLDCGGLGRFLTLTYAEDPGALEYRDFQLFMKRYRLAYGSCRFFAVGEYGNKGGRGHWHAIIFGHAQTHVGHLVLPEWSKGYSFDGAASVESIGYVAGYVLKKEVQSLPSIVRASNRPGIGLGAVSRLAQVTASSMCGRELPRWPVSFAVSGKKYPLTDGALVKFKSVFLEEGGLPPREDDPELRSLVNQYYIMGDSFLEERRVRDVYRKLERSGGNGSFPTRGSI